MLRLELARRSAAKCAHDAAETQPLPEQLATTLATALGISPKTDVAASVSSDVDQPGGIKRSLLGVLDAEHAEKSAVASPVADSPEDLCKAPDNQLGLEEPPEPWSPSMLSNGMDVEKEMGHDGETEMVQEKEKEPEIEKIDGVEKGEAVGVQQDQEVEKGEAVGVQQDQEIEKGEAVGVQQDQEIEKGEVVGVQQDQEIEMKAENIGEPSQEIENDQEMEEVKSAKPLGHSGSDLPLEAAEASADGVKDEPGQTEAQQSEIEALIDAAVEASAEVLHSKTAGSADVPKDEPMEVIPDEDDEPPVVTRREQWGLKPPAKPRGRKPGVPKPKAEPKPRGRPRLPPLPKVFMTIDDILPPTPGPSEAAKPVPVDESEKPNKTKAAAKTKAKAQAVKGQQRKRAPKRKPTASGAAAAQGEGDQPDQKAEEDEKNKIVWTPVSRIAAPLVAENLRWGPVQLSQPAMRSRGLRILRRKRLAQSSRSRSFRLRVMRL